MKLYKLTLLRLKLYFKNPTLAVSFTVFLVILWAILKFTSINEDEVLVLPIAIIDLDQSAYSKLIIDRVSKKETISISSLSQAEALKQVSTGKLEAVYILKEGLMDHILEGKLAEIIEIVKSPVSLSAGLIGELFAGEVMRLSSSVDAANSVVGDYGTDGQDLDLWEAAWDFTESFWEPSPLITIDYSPVNNNHQIKTDYLQATTHIKSKIGLYLMASLILFSLLVGVGSLIKEKNTGILNRVMSTQTPLWTYLLSSILSILILHTLGTLLIYTLVTFT